MTKYKCFKMCFLNVVRNAKLRPNFDNTHELLFSQLNLENSNLGAILLLLRRTLIWIAVTLKMPPSKIQDSFLLGMQN
jgi:hypothetical protein